MEKAVAVAAVDVTRDIVNAANLAKTPKSAHATADPAREEVNYDGASKFHRKLNEEIENHQAMMALMEQSV